MAFKGVQRILDRLEIKIDTANQKGLELQTTDDDETNPAISLLNSSGAETAHWQPLGRLRLGGGSDALPNLVRLLDIATGLSFASNVVRFSTGGTRRITINSTGLGVGTSSPALHSAIDLQRTDRAALLNRWTTAQRNGITATNGMVGYNTDTNKFQGYANGAWVDLH